MQSAKLLLATAVIFISSSLFAAATASAQTLDGVWLKTRFQVRGYSVNPATGEDARYNRTQWVYMTLTNMGGGPPPIVAWDYNLTSYTETTPGSWTTTDHGIFSTSPASERFFPDMDLTLPGLGGASVSLAYTPAVKITTDNLGAIKSVRWKGRGEVYDGNDGSGNLVYGFVHVSAKEIDISKCPFIP